MWPLFLDIYLFLLAGVSTIGLARYKSFDTPAKIIVVYILLTTLSETIAHYLSINFRNNLIVYHIYNPIQFFLFSVYYNILISFFKKFNIGLLIGASGVALSIFNSVFFQKPYTQFNTYFLIVESILIIGMTLTYFYDFLNSDNVTKDITTSDFWISCLLLIFWSFTFFNWLAEATMPQIIDQNIEWVRYMNWFINIITYGGIGLILLFYNKSGKT